MHSIRLRKVLAFDATEGTRGREVLVPSAWSVDSDSWIGRPELAGWGGPLMVFVAVDGITNLNLHVTLF
jgi:hypothetical protein